MRDAAGAARPGPHPTRNLTYGLVTSPGHRRGDDPGLLRARAGAQRGGDDPGPFAEQGTEVELGAPTALQPDDDEPAPVGEGGDIAGEVLRTHVVENDISATSVGRRVQLGNKVVLAVVHEDRGAEVRAGGELLSRSGSHGDGRAELTGDLGGHRPDAGRAAMDEEHLSGVQAGGHDDIRPDRRGDLWQRGGVGQRHAARHGHDLAERDGDLLGALVAIPMLAGLCGMLLVRRDPVLTRRAT